MLGGKRLILLVDGEPKSELRCRLIKGSWFWQWCAMCPDLDTKTNVEFTPLDQIPEPGPEYSIE